MRLINFALREPVQTIELLALGLAWDLHNFADFGGLQAGPDGTATLTWIVPLAENPWGDSGNKHSGCKLVFRSVRFLQIRGGDPGVPGAENVTLAGLSKVVPDPVGYRFRAEWDPADEFHLLFEFQGGLTIEVASDEAEFLPLRAEAAA